MAPIQVFAGRTALSRLQDEGWHPHLFSYFLGASGGPKWFILAGLDRVIFPEFFKYHSGHIDIIGSSAGAFRGACFVQRDPLAAVNRLIKHYSRTVYSSKASEVEITEKARELLYYVLPGESVLELLANDSFHLHVIAAKCKRLMAFENPILQGAGLLASAVSNLAGRKYLGHHYQRIVFSTRGSNLKLQDPFSVPTQHLDMGYSTVRDAILASGAIPLVMQGTEYIVGAPDGIYRDGGLIDYHFDLKIGPRNGLVLYPHFYPTAIPGWFDKKLASRRPHASSYDNVIMVVPSPEFIASLPFGKIPDRSDFKKMDDRQRLQYWQTVISQSDELGDYFMGCVNDGSIVDLARPLPFKCIEDQ